MLTLKQGGDGDLVGVGAVPGKEETWLGAYGLYRQDVVPPVGIVVASYV
jgi:hypothetical protein